MQSIQYRALWPTLRTRWAAPCQTSRISPSSHVRAYPPPWPSLSASTLEISPVPDRLENNRPSRARMKTMNLFFMYQPMTKKSTANMLFRAMQNHARPDHSTIRAIMSEALKPKCLSDVRPNQIQRTEGDLILILPKASQSILNWYIALGSV